MATITLTIPDAVVTRVLDGISGSQAYSRNALPSETKAAFAKRMLIDVAMNWVSSWEEEQARQTARTTASTDIAIT